ncbi:MAG TPA: DUF1330 domain-containing protein [Solirubrobacteraceae bacterium]|nr:DUF1330 domain-containing protein [Solirubrobacteraceae bacterium]
MSRVDPSAEQVARLAELPAEQPVVMINLLAFKPDGGAESYARYAAEVQPHLERVGGRLIFGGSALQMVIGEHPDPWWDVVLAVEYPSVQAFLSMVADPDYQAIHVHRENALQRAELIATAQGM